MMKRTFVLTILCIFFAVVPGIAQHKHQTDKHHSEVNRRGDHAMGFSHQKATHRFRLIIDGGAIEVTANDEADAGSRDQIRRHLEEISALFKAGDFEKPLFTHGKVPPGVTAMKRLKSEINYKYEEIDRGGRVRLVTNNQEALRAIHEFLRFQIEDHQTGDSLDVEKQD
jgi:hypothetical protein